MSNRYCEKCGAVVDETQKFCVSCGTPISQSELFDKMESNMDEKVLENNILIDQQKRVEEEHKKRVFAKAYLEKQNSLSNNYLLGFVGALLGALVGAIPWAIVSSQGWFVAWLGYLIAVAASKGYDLMKVKTNMKKLWCVAGAVIIGVLFGQMLSDTIIIAMDDELGGMFSDVLLYFASNFGEYLSAVAGNLILGYIFAALGGFSVLRDIKKETAIIEELKNANLEDTNI